MQRQLIEEPRDHAKSIVNMVLECAAEAAGPAYKPHTRRINVFVKAVEPFEFGGGFCDHVLYIGGRNGAHEYANNAYGPARNDSAPTALTNRLRGLVGHHVALWVTDDEFFPLPTIVESNDMGLCEC
jgi:hypothetical protein